MRRFPFLNPHTVQNTLYLVPNKIGSVRLHNSQNAKKQAPSLFFFCCKVAFFTYITFELLSVPATIICKLDDKNEMLKRRVQKLKEEVRELKR